MKSLHREAEKHLKRDIKGYKKEKKYLSEEIEEDKELIKKFKGKKKSKRNK